MSILTLEHVTKRFGRQMVLNDLNLIVPEGRIFGFLGENGAGKTTTMKLILGLLRADQGVIKVNGEPVTFGQTTTNRLIGYLPDVPAFYDYMRPQEYLQLCGEISGLSKDCLNQRSTELLTRVGLANTHQKIGGFSRGMKQRLGIAQALLNEPRLLICDEPTSALDPVGRLEILDILQQLKGQTTVFFSTHVLADVERICDEIAILHAGKIALTGQIDDLKAKHATHHLRVKFATTAELNQFISLGWSDFQTDLVSFSVTLTAPDILKLEMTVMQALATQQLTPISLERTAPTLEQLFMEVVQ